MNRIRTHLGQIVDAVIAAAFCAVGLFEVLVRPLAEDVVEGPVALNVVAVLLSTVVANDLHWRWLCVAGHRWVSRS